MKTTIDEAAATVTVSQADGRSETFPLASNAGFMAVSRAWLRAGWDAKYVYGFSWFGRPVIQLPDDMVRIQEVIHAVQPDVVVETGVAHGGSLVFYASLFAALGNGRVVGIDIEIRPHNRHAIEAHPLAGRIELLEGSSTDTAILDAVRAGIAPGERVLVVLDSNHSRDHVRAELEAYAPMVTPGSYIVATDGIMQQVAGAPRTGADWEWNNPLSAIDDFLEGHPEFECIEPAFPFNEGAVSERVTYWPRAYLRRKG